MSDQTSATELILALRRLNRTLVTVNRAVGTRLGIKDGDLVVLDLLHQEGPQTPTDLARRTRTHLATMTGILTRLERDGWIERIPDAHDRRSVRIQATGVTRLTKIYADTNARLAILVADWPPEQLTAMTALFGEVSALGEDIAIEIAEPPLSGSTPTDPGDQS